MVLYTQLGMAFPLEMTSLHKYTLSVHASYIITLCVCHCMSTDSDTEAYIHTYIHTYILVHVYYTMC